MNVDNTYIIYSDIQTGINTDLLIIVEAIQLTIKGLT